MANLFRPAQGPDWLPEFRRSIERELERKNVLDSYTVAALPDATTQTGAMIFVSDETGGAVPAFSDGTNWRRVTDRAVVS